MPSLKAMAREAQKKPKAGAPKQAPSRKQTIFKSTERVADSDLESETESESDSGSEDGFAIAQIPIAKPNGQKPKPVAAPSEVGSKDEDEEDESKFQGDTVVSNNTVGASGHNSDESKSESNGGSDSERESDEEHDYGKAGVAAEKISSLIEEKTPAKSVKSRAIPIYSPPDGFTIPSESSDGKQTVAEVFGRSNLAGKQLWYITAPASVPISAVKQVSLHDVQLGKPALSFGGRQYGFVLDQAGDRSFTKVLIPEGNSTTYCVGQKGVDQILHLQEIVQLHKTTDMSSQYSGVRATIAQNSVRKQPEGLKMRFRPIGFGDGKTGSIGLSSSSSDVSSSTKSDTDDEMGDAPPASRQSLNLDLADTRLSEHASKGNESQDDTSSSDSSSETSSDEMEDVPKSTSVPKISPSSPPRPLKRKLSDFKKDNKTSNALYEQFKANGMPLKTQDIKKLGPVPEGLASKVDSHASTNEQKISSTLSSRMTQVRPPQTSRSAPSPLKSPKPKETPVPTPRQPSILPPGRGSKSTAVPRVVKTTGAGSETSSIRGSGTLLPLEKKPQRGLEVRPHSIDPALSEKERKKEIRRLKKKDAGHASKSQRRESFNSATNDTLDRSINACPPSGNAHQHSFEARSPTKPSSYKDSSKEAKSSQIKSTERVLKTPKKHTSSTITQDENGGIPRSSHAASMTIPSPRKESVILPPKFVRSISR